MPFTLTGTEPMDAFVTFHLLPSPQSTISYPVLVKFSLMHLPTICYNQSATKT